MEALRANNVGHAWFVIQSNICITCRQVKIKYKFLTFSKVRSTVSIYFLFNLYTRTKYINIIPIGT